MSKFKDNCSICNKKKVLYTVAHPHAEIYSQVCSDECLKTYELKYNMEAAQCSQCSTIVDKVHINKIKCHKQLGIVVSGCNHCIPLSFIKCKTHNHKMFIFKKDNKIITENKICYCPCDKETK